MIHQKSLQDLTESYLKSLISEVAGSLSPDFDSSAPFGELGIDSSCALKIISTISSEQVLEMVLLQEASLDDSYEKVTF